MTGVVDSPERGRFELTEGGLTAFATYRRHDQTVVIPHVEAPPALRGKGTAALLMQGVAEMARAQSFTVLPTCSYARIWFMRHPEYADILYGAAR
jgi:predicted GNAT family acetyltransferase